MISQNNLMKMISQHSLEFINSLHNLISYKFHNIFSIEKGVKYLEV